MTSELEHLAKVLETVLGSSNKPARFSTWKDLAAEVVSEARPTLIVTERPKLYNAHVPFDQREIPNRTDSGLESLAASTARLRKHCDAMQGGLQRRQYYSRSNGSNGSNGSSSSRPPSAR